MENERDNDECYNLDVMFDKVQYLFKKTYSNDNDGWNFFLSRKLDIKSSCWKDRYNWVITLYYISGFNNKEFNNNFNSIIETLASIIKNRDEDYRVFYVVFNFINEFLQEEDNERVNVIIGHSNDIISNVLSYIGSNKQVDKSAFQLINSISKFDEIHSIVFQHRDQILTKVLQSLQTMDTATTEHDNYSVNVISTIFSKFNDDKYKSGNINYYNVIIPVLLNLLNRCYNQSNIKQVSGDDDLMKYSDDEDEDEDENIDYFYKVLEAISFLVISVESIVSSDQCIDIIKLILSLPIFNVAYNKSISITLRSLFRFIQSIDYNSSNSCKDVNFMPLVMSKILFLINDNYTLNSLLDKTILKNISTAIDMMVQLVSSNISNNGIDLISPYIEQFYKVLVESMINFNPFHKSGIEIEIKSTLLIKSIVINNNNNSQLLETTFQKISQSIGIDKKPSTISIKLQTLSELLKLNSEATTTTPPLSEELIVHIISNSFNSIQQIEKNNKDRLKGIKVIYNSNGSSEDDTSSDNGDYIDQINEIEESYDELTSVIQIVSTMGSCKLVDQLVGLFLIQVLNLVKKSNNVNIKSNMICVLDYFLENCSGVNIFRNYSKIIELLIDCFIKSTSTTTTSASTSCIITQSSVYGIGIVAEKSGILFSPFQNSIFNSLKQFIQFTNGNLVMSNSRDNAISAIGKIIRFQLNESTNSITIIQDYLNTFINSLPIQSDFDELPSILSSAFFILVTYSKLLSKDNIDKLFNTIEICNNRNIQLDKSNIDYLNNLYSLK